MAYEVIIIGSGPAGLTAGIYLGRFKRSPLIVQGMLPGGQLMKTGAVENWPGEMSVDGPVLMKKIEEQAQKCGSSFLQDEVVHVDFSKKPVVVVTRKKGELLAYSLIIATGSSPKKLGCSGEETYWGRGVNVCATCDAPLYKDKVVVVVGGGNSAIAESFALSKYARKVTIIQAGTQLTATDPLKDEVLAKKNVEVMYNKKVMEILGDGERVTSVILKNQQDQAKSELETEGVFVAIGMKPNTELFIGIEVNDNGYIMWKEGMQTSVDGVFAAGDVADYKYRQAITAAGQGCAAALECERWLRKRKVC